jgi:hypothetical protein
MILSISNTFDKNQLAKNSPESYRKMKQKFEC